MLGYADHPRVRVLLEDKPSGKGHAVREGLKIATGDILLIQDADLEYDLDDYEKLLEPIRSYEASFVLGSRASRGRERMADPAFRRTARPRKRLKRRPHFFYLVLERGVSAKASRSIHDV